MVPDFWMIVAYLAKILIFKQITTRYGTDNLYPQLLLILQRY